ncbi:MAG TPA: helix-hairpin-helix domain-containing protein [Coriobacteriia bacterium]|nr:helix-hairpin-helix domain-containing protein [Coriobacteriia bacterium]
MGAYDNNAVAAKLDLYADLLEVSGADKYRFLSFKKAASSIRAWPEQVSALRAEGRLTEVPGIGAKVARIVEDILRSGSFPELEELSLQYPASLVTVMAVPGVGPKRALLLHQKLGICDVDALQAAIADGRVERLGGFGTKTAQKMAASVESYRRHSERLTLAEALPTAEQLVRDLTALPEVSAVELAGSVRRRAETVRNIDLVVSSSDLDAAASAVSELPAVERLLEREPGHLTLELHNGTPVDVRFVPPSSLGAAMAYWTGSIDVGDALAEHARGAGYTFGPGGLLHGDEPVDVRSEADLFSALGLDDIPPEAREDASIVRRAADHTVPVLVTLDGVRGDLQSHSTFTDGKNSLLENRAVAAELGYEYFAATDHAYDLRMVGGLSVDDLERQWAEIDELNERRDGAPRILKGVELNISEVGGLDYDDDVLSRFDIVLASLHSGWDQDEATITKRMLSAIAHPLVDVIAHPTGRILGRRDPMLLDMRTVLEAAGETGTLMEINSYPDRLDLSDEHIRMARSFGVRFSLGTDAHAAQQLRYMRYGVAQARRGLVTSEELVNAHPWEVARTWLKRYHTLGQARVR